MIFFRRAIPGTAFGARAAAALLRTLRSARTAPEPPARWAIKIAILAGLYVAAAKLGLSLSVAYGNVTPVWPPTGISLAALLLFGFRLWPGVALGAFLANATTPVGPWTSLGIATGNTLEAVVGAYLLRRVAFQNPLERVRDVLAIATLAALFSTAVSATFGATSLWVAGEIPSSRYRYAWGLWWFGDAMGDLLVAPLLLVWARPLRNLSLRRIGEGALLLAALGGASWATFFGSRWSYPFLVFPLLIWAALRFRHHGATAAAVLVSSLAVWATLRGSVPIVGATLTQSVAILQTLMSGIALTMLILAATISERERAESVLQRRETQLEEAQQIAHIGSWEWDIPGNRVTWSDELYRIYGLRPQEFAATYDAFLERVHPDDRALVAHAVERALAEHSPFSFDHRVVRPDGTERTIHGRGEVIADESGNPLRMLGTAQDISDQRKAEEERLRLDTAKSEFIQNAAHELRTPLATVGTVVSALADRRQAMTEEELERCFAILARGGERVNDLITKLLDLSQIEHGVRVDLQPVGLAAAARRAIEAVSPPAGTSVAIDVDEGLAVLADRTRLEQVLVNLLTNAYRYGGASIRLTAVQGREGVTMALEDDGPGIPASLEGKLFEPFTRGGTPGRGQQPGSGLGLAIVRRLVEAFGGEIRYESRRPHGARFVVRLRQAA